MVRIPMRLLRILGVLGAAAVLATAGPAKSGPGGTAHAESTSTVAVTSAYSTGSGSIREAIEKANADSGVRRIESRLPAGTLVQVFRALPDLKAPGVVLDAGGLTLTGTTCVRPDGRRGCDGLVVAGPDIEVRNLRATGFTFDGIAVRGPDAKRVRIVDCHAFANEDDGVGVSHGASDVVVEGCTLERNGFRTKGKGILVFEYASAELRRNTVRYNRDGVTVSRRARAHLVGNQIVDNYDKGLGVTGAEATGSDNLIARNGIKGPQGEPGPNADGLRVTLDSRVQLDGSQITGNGDVGIVVLGSSNVVLRGGRVSGHKGPGVHARENAVVELRGLDLTGNAGGEFRIDDQAKIVRSGDEAALPAPSRSSSETSTGLP